MIRLIKRYGSRKLYDTEESRYVSLSELAERIRQGDEIKVVDRKTGEDVTTQTLVQIISEVGRKSPSYLPSDLLHELIRLGGRAISSGVEQLEHGVDKLLQASLERFAPIRGTREEMMKLRQKVEELERVVRELQRGGAKRG